MLLGTSFFQTVVEAEVEEYVIGPADELSITFWQEPQLNSEVRVGSDGRIVIPVVGSMTAAGLTPSQLGRKIVDKISIFSKSITQASVVVAQYGSNKVYLTGQVRQPGKKAFEKMPNIWDAILEAGGPTEEAALSQVAIIRGGRGKGKKILVDLPKYINNGELNKLPKLQRGDTIFIPALRDPNGQNRAASPFVQQNTVSIYGAVRTAGNFQITAQMNLFHVLGLAGGTTEHADLSRIRIISTGEVTPVVTEVNLADNQRIAATKPIILHAGDTIIVPPGDGSYETPLWRQFLVDIITTGVTATISVLLYRSF